MKIALSANGRSPHTERWATAFAARGHEVTVVWEVDQVSEPALARYGSDVRHMARAPWSSSVRARPCLIEQARPSTLASRIKPDLVQGMYLVRHGWTAALLGRPLVQFALGSDVLALHREPGPAARLAPGSLYATRRTLHAVECADVVLCDSMNVAETLHSYAPRVRVELVRIGVEMSPGARSTRPWREELRIADDAFVLLSTRLMTPNYNIDTIIRAFAIVARSHPDAVMILKDFRSFGDEAYRESCRKLIQELQIEERVRVVGELERPDLLALYKAADVFVSVPSSDAMSVSVMEAMAAEVPVVASRTDGIDASMLSHEVSALLVEPGDVTSLADVISQLHDSPARRRSLAAEAVGRVRAVADFEREISRVERLYMELADMTGRLDPGPRAGVGSAAKQ